MGALCHLQFYFESQQTSFGLFLRSCISRQVSGLQAWKPKNGAWNLVSMAMSQAQGMSDIKINLYTCAQRLPRHDFIPEEHCHALLNVANTSQLLNTSCHIYTSHICVHNLWFKQNAEHGALQPRPLSPDISDSAETSWTAVAQVALLLRTDDEKNKTQQADKCTEHSTNPASTSHFWWIKVEDGLYSAEFQKQTQWFVLEWENLGKCKMSQVSGNPPLPHPTHIPLPHS